MNRPQRSIEIFTMSALDLFVTAMGSFAILMMILFPYYNADKKKAAEDQQEHKETPPGPGPDSETDTMEKGDVLFCVWPTRVQDYEKFVEETGYDGRDPRSTIVEGSILDGDLWRKPGFEQSPTHPVVGVNWLDARNFCKWLTEKERKSGEIGPLDEYRLPTNDEWTAAVGSEKYPWGDTWPVPEKTANLSGLELAPPLGYAPVVPGYDDGYAFTSPVGSFAPNRYGLYDMAGNVNQWCLDWYRPDMNSAAILAGYDWLSRGVAARTRRVTRGSSWFIGDQGMLQSQFHNQAYQSNRSEYTGFRCVLVVRTPKTDEAKAKP